VWPRFIEIIAQPGAVKQTSDLTRLEVIWQRDSNVVPWEAIMPELSRPTQAQHAQDWRRRAKILETRIRECFLFDSAVIRLMMGLAGSLAGWALYSWGKVSSGFELLAKAHRAALAPWANGWTIQLIRDARQRFLEGKSHPLHPVYAEYVQKIEPTPQTRKFFEKPERLFQGSAIVLKSPRSNERGVLAVQYSYVYPLLAKFFDLDKIAARYYLVLEPSWSGFCDLNVLIYTQLRQPVFVGSIEPRDTDFIRRLESNLIAVPFSSNTWVDDRVFRPLPEVAKDTDIIMVAGWARYKRHYAFFRGLYQLRQRRVQPKVILAGYPIDLTKDEILEQADHYGVRDLLEIHQWATPAEVNQLLNRAKVNVLWSRREGATRAIVEGMLAGTPCLVREGFNYGYHYPHINSGTGRFSTESELSHNLFEMIENHHRYSPREWVLANMSCLRTTKLLNGAIRTKATELGDNWTVDIVPKVNELNCVRYWNAEDEMRFRGDYEFLRSCIRTKPKV
jgi:glycosyltransferase involved in cell wall biosynthesis